MAEHKAPTQVTVITEEKAAFAQYIEDNWKMWAIAAAVVSIGILVFQYSSIQGQQGSMALWDKLNQVTEFSPTTGGLAGDMDELKKVAAELQGTPVEPFALAAEVQVAIGERDYSAAGAAISALNKVGFPPLTKDSYKLGAGGVEGTLADHLAGLIAKQEKWENEHQSLFSNPPLPEGSPRVELETSAGKVVLGLYQEAAPKHVENFLKLVDSGYYVGTRFHRVIKGFMVQGGDPNTKDLTKLEEWGQGGPGYKLDSEDSGLSHFSGFLSAAKQPGETQSSGSQFFLTTGDAHWLDGQHVVYGVVLEGQDVVSAIEAGKIDPEDGQGSRPLDPVEVLSTKRL